MTQHAQNLNEKEGQEQKRRGLAEHSQPSLVVYPFQS